MSQMETSRLLFVIVVVMSPLVSTADGSCKDFDVEFRGLLRGEQFYFKPYAMRRNLSNDDVMWYRDDSLNEPLSTDQNQDVHYWGGVLLFMNLKPEDSGNYTAVENTSQGCSKHHVEIKVFDAANETSLYYGRIKNSFRDKRIPCPGPVSKICSTMKGKMSWKKNFQLLLGNSGRYLLVPSANMTDEGVYTCVCTWTYNQRQCISSASRRLQMLRE